MNLPQSLIPQGPAPLLHVYENHPLPLSLPLDGGGKGGGDFHPSLCSTRAWGLLWTAVNDHWVKSFEERYGKNHRPEKRYGNKANPRNA